MQTQTLRQKRTRLELPWSVFEPLLLEICQKLNAGQNEAMEALGYSSSPISSWKKKGAVPLLAVNAAHGILRKERIHTQFNMMELSRIFTALTGTTLPPKEWKSIIVKIADEIAHSAHSHDGQG